MNLPKRVEELEKRFRGPGNFTLVMPDGRTEFLPVKAGETKLDWYNRVLRDLRSREAVLIRECVTITDPDGGRIGEVLQAFLQCEGVGDPNEFLPEDQSEGTQLNQEGENTW